MEDYSEITDRRTLSPTEKNKPLFLKQKALPDAFHKRNTISKENFDMRLRGLRKKIGIR